jgi:hypothetical protein
MEDVLALYQLPYDPKRPLVCMDETSKQLVKEVRKPLPMRPGQIARTDYEYERNGVSNIFMFTEPLVGDRTVMVTDRRTKVDWARAVKELIDNEYPDADTVILVADNLNTHSKGAFYEAFDPREARQLAKKVEIHYTPKHGSWLNIAEIELSVLSRQCLARRIGTKAKLKAEVAEWQSERNDSIVGVDWQFTTDDARVKLKSLYPMFER